MLALNAIVAADAFLVPVSPSYLDYQGLMSLFEMIHYVRAELGEAAPVLGVVLTRVDPGSDLAETATQQLREYCGGKVFDTKIRSSAMLREAPIMGKDIFRYAPRSDGARDYARLVNEIEERLQRYGNMMSRLEDSGPTDRASGTSPGRNGTNGSEAAGQRLPSTEELKAKLSL
jgi:chromosome partitioning protein